MFGLKLNKYEPFYPLEVVGRVSGTHFEVGKNLFILLSALNLAWSPEFTEVQTVSTVKIRRVDICK